MGIFSSPLLKKTNPPCLYEEFFAAGASSMALNVSFLNGLAGFVIGFISVWNQGLGYECDDSKRSRDSVALNGVIRASTGWISEKTIMEQMVVQLEGNIDVELWTLWIFKPGSDPPWRPRFPLRLVFVFSRIIMFFDDLLMYTEWGLSLESNS